jgi:hypothetical protein
MTNDELNPNDETRNGAEAVPRLFRHSAFDIPSAFVIRVSSFQRMMSIRG